jgi:hypothetical protein
MTDAANLVINQCGFSSRDSRASMTNAVNLVDRAVLI